MEKKHRDIIRTNYVKLIELYSEVIEEICSDLIQTGVLNKSLKNEILMGNRTPDSQASAMLDKVTCRGPKAFDKLYEATLSEECYKAADILKPENSPHEPKNNTYDARELRTRLQSDEFETSILKENWTTEKYFSDLHCERLQLEKVEYDILYQEQFMKLEDIYPMKNKRRGKPFILVDGEINPLDKAGIKALVQQLHFDSLKVVKQRDGTIPTELYNNQVDCLMLFVITNGRKEFTINHVIQAVRSKLPGIPKVIFHLPGCGTTAPVQTHELPAQSTQESSPGNENEDTRKDLRQQGGEEDLEHEEISSGSGIKITTQELQLKLRAESGKQPETAATMQDIHGEGVNDNDRKRDEAAGGDYVDNVDAHHKDQKMNEAAGKDNVDGLIPKDADIFYIKSTADGQEILTENSNHKKWTRFIQHFIYIFSKCAHRYDLDGLVKLANCLEEKPVAISQNRLRKVLHFYPGRYEEEENG